MSEGSSGLIRLVFVFAIFVLIATVSVVSYSTAGYTFTKYPGIAGEAVVCVEGEVNPTNQTITVTNDGELETMNPWVSVNGVRHLFNMSLSDKALRQKTSAMVLGCNNVSWGADTDTGFKVRLDYLSHWRPIVNYLEIGNLQVGHSVRYFISTGDSGKTAVMARLNLTDITRDIDSKPLFCAEFNGSAVRYKMEEPGNYKADMQVYDGYVWSDVYEVGFTSHVITTEEQKRAYRLYELEDDPVCASPGLLPAAISPEDNDGLKIAKRAADGAYVLWVRVFTFVRHLLRVYVTG